MSKNIRTLWNLEHDIKICENKLWIIYEYQLNVYYFITIVCVMKKMCVCVFNSYAVQLWYNM